MKTDQPKYAESFYVSKYGPCPASEKNAPTFTYNDMIEFANDFHQTAEIQSKEPEKSSPEPGKTLWNYALGAAMIGLIIGISWGVVLGVVLTIKTQEPPKKTNTFIKLTKADAG